MRALINVLSEMPSDWYRAISSWREMNHHLTVETAGASAPSPNEEYFFYQTLVGAWPLKPMNPEEHLAFVDRIERYMEKALREAKVHSSWIHPNGSYEDAVRRFVRGALELSPENEFLDAFIPFRCHIARAGMLNALSQVLLKATAPGVPDFYQGSELWNLTLVDPDNRGPVDFARRRALLDQLDRAAGGQPASFVDRIIQNPGDGLIKLYVTSRALRFRRQNHELFAKGAYLPLRAVGDRQRHVIGFARTFGGRHAIVLAGRFFLELGAGQALPVGEPAWRDSAVLVRTELRSSQYRDVFTQHTIQTEVQSGKTVLPLQQVFAHLPLALLVGEKTT